MHTDLIYCVVTISNKVGLYTVCRDSYLTDAANDFNEKTNNNRNLHSTLIYLFFFNLFVKH